MNIIFRIIIIGLIIFTVGLAYNLYNMIKIDAESRGFKHKKLISLLSVTAQNGSGLLLYLLARKKYDSQMTALQRKEFEHYKKLSLIFFVIQMALGLAAIIYAYLYL